NQSAEHRAIDIGTLPALPRLHHRGKRRERAIKPGAEIADRNAALDWRPAFLAGHAHHAAHRLHGDVERALLRIRAGLAVARYRTVDQTRVVLAQIVVAEAETLRHAGAIVLDEKIRLRY